MLDSIIYFFLPLVILLLVSKYHRSTKCHKNLPPTPPALPILGHLRLLKPPLHRTLHHLSRNYGSIISLRFGYRLVVVVSSASAVEECFTKNDIILANRPKLLVGKLLGYNNSTMPTSSYGEHWRNLRRIATIEIFSSQRLNMFLGIRKDEIKRLIRKLCRSDSSNQDFSRVGLRPMFRDLTFNIMMRTIAGKRYYGEDLSSDQEEANQFRGIMEEIASYAGVTNRGDFLPILNWIDGGRLKKKLIKLGEKTDRFLQGLIDEHRDKKGNLENNNTMIDHLLTSQQSQPEYYTDEIIKAMILSLILAGTDTAAVTLEWAMSALLNQPTILFKAIKEINDQVGEDQLVDEFDLSKLPYLKNIILETFRLYPPVPLLLPHVSSQNCTIGGYNVPRDTLVLVNSWAIHRDPALWEDPLNYRPERFENGEGEGFKLMPFGLGRRSCPGAGLAQRVVGLTLGILIQCFEWKRVSKEEIEMIEGGGLTMPRAHPLEALCKPQTTAHYQHNLVSTLIKLAY